MADALSDLERFWHSESNLPPLVRLALIHYQFEAIHPFLDGNGRIGRLLVTLLLCADGLLPQPLLYLSAFFERYREDYYARLLGVSRHGAWAEWIMLFLRGVSTQSQDAIRRSRLLVDLEKSYRRTLHEAGVPVSAQILMECLFERPAVAVSQAAALMSCTVRAAQGAIDRLRGLGILEETTGRRRNRIYVAREIIAIVEATEPPSLGD